MPIWLIICLQFVVYETRLPNFMGMRSMIPAKGARISVKDRCNLAKATSAFAWSNLACAMACSFLETMFLSATAIRCCQIPKARQSG